MHWWLYAKLGWMHLYNEDKYTLTQYFCACFDKNDALHIIDNHGKHYNLNWKTFRMIELKEPTPIISCQPGITCGPMVIYIILVVQMQIIQVKY